jgi:hypothetical protein
MDRGSWEVAGGQQGAAKKRCHRGQPHRRTAQAHSVAGRQENVGRSAGGARATPEGRRAAPGRAKGRR